MKEFIALHNRTVSRHEIQTVIALAKEQNNTEVIYRLSKILNDHPDSNRFNINIINYPQETDNQAGLAGTRHSGDYREALDECGRLKKGWHFVDGKVVKVQKRSGLLSQYTEKEFGHPFPKALKEKFKELNWKYDRKNKRYYTPVPENEAEKEQHARMFAFIEQEKSRIEANGNFPSAPSSAKSTPSSNKNTPKKNYTAESFAKDLDYNTLKRSYSWISFDPDARAERDIKQWGEIFYSLYNSLSEEAKKQGVLEAYNTAFDNGYTALLKLEKEIIATRSKTFSTAITGGAGITEKQVSTNEKRMRQQSEKSELWNQKYDKLHKLLEKIAKNKPVDQYEEGDVIKSTDNNAMTKLKQKLKMLQDRKTMLKNGVVAAKEYQKNKDLSVFKKYNIDKETTDTIVNHIDNGGSPTEKGMYNWFTMPYLNRDIKEVEKRIAILEKNQAKGKDEILIEGGKIVYNGEAQRLQIFFEGVPSKEVREALKAHAFKWAPTAKAWQRTLTENAKYAVNQYLLKTGILKLRTALSSPSHNDEIAFLSAAGIDYFPEAPDDETQGLGKPVPAADIYKMVTDKIIGMLKSASPTDYHRAWKDDAFFIPLNYDSKKPYRGINRLLLQERIGFAGAFRNPYFLTFKQIKKHKGTLKKGAKGYEVIYYSIRYVVPADKNSGRKAFSSTNAHKVLDFLDKYKLSEDIVTRIPMIRYYNVYNGADIENIDFKLDELQIGRAVPDSATENRAAQLIVENYPNPPAIKHEGNEAYYNPASDYIKLPKQEQFDTVNDYYRTLFHELTHSTGHNKRLNRGIHLMLEKDDYAKEELVAEFGAVFLSAWAGIMWYNNKNHAAYLKGWNSAIKEAQNDNKFLMRAASLAQQSTDYILNLNPAGQPAFLKKLQPKKATKKENKKEETSTKNAFLEEYRQLKAKYPEHLIIVSMEDHQNYCMYGKDAIIAADILKLQLLKLKRNDEFSISVGFKYKNLREYLEKLVKAGYKVALKESLYEPQSSPKKNTPKTPTDKSAPSDSSSNKNTKKKAPRTTQYKGVKTIPLTDLYTDEKRFQNRKKLNEEIVENIVNNFKPTDLDPLVVWYDEKQGKTFVLAGHHRYEALKRLGHKTVPVKYANDDYPTEADAIRYAKEISNANRTLEEPYERAAIYRKYRDEGYSEKEINEKANIEGKNRSYILNLSYLNPKGSTMSTLVQFSQTQSKADKNEIERIADWIGQARRNAPELTNAHEQEMFDFLMNKEASKRTSTKAKFLEYVRACWNPFAPSEPLNLARMKYQSEGEKQYDEEVENLKTQISTYQGYIDNLKDRFINPSNKDFVNPTAPDYMAVKKIADDKIAEYNTKIQYYQSQLMKVYQNKQTYIKPTGQTALFGTLPTFKTRKEAKKYFKAWAAENLTGKKVYHKELDKYVVFSSRGIDHVLSSNISFNKMKLILQAEEMLKNSHLIAFEEDYKKRENIKGVYRMRSNAVLEGEDIKVILTLREGENGVIYYDHKIEEIKESTTPPRKSLANPFCGDSAPTNTPAKTVPNSALSAPEVFVEHSPDPATQSTPSITPRNNSLANKMATLQNRTFETFIIAEPQMQAFLGDVERKNTGSTAITITGGAGSGKTRFAFQFINALAQNYKVGHASLEEQPDSKLYFDKVQQYLDQTAQANVEAPEIENMQDLQALIERNDVIVIDSFTKIREWDRNFLLDRDLRKKYNGKLFLIIFQQTVAGNMRGGTTSEFDGDIILYTQVFPDYRENYIYPSKNRYNSTPSEQLRYSVYHQQLLPSESTQPDSSPVTSNTYEVIY
ncbi:zincin-like metallopeptidase domain-containing protein [Capnocytophaga sputigena]|uniref:zincin-like metallopeptidase domain-containing protein n=1 Tax=Capnocytophaga sputigena TaxID=1019 RepID=UPI00248D794D|nr:zincin-like metallopeptidase domain-containing protein [Capnocytophaga sputigena]